MLITRTEFLSDKSLAEDDIRKENDCLAGSLSFPSKTPLPGNMIMHLLIFEPPGHPFYFKV